MRYSLVDILLRRAGALAAFGALSLLSACASTSLPQSSFMTVGERAPAPMGYLEFCARRPEQCGLNQAADARGQVIDAELRAQDLRRRYYWAVALADTAVPAPRLTPAAGGSDTDVSSISQSMWRGSAPAASVDMAPRTDVGPRLDPATWGGSTRSLLQPAVLETPAPESPATETPVTAPQDLFKPDPQLQAQAEPGVQPDAQVQAAPPAAPSATTSDDPYNLHDADGEAPRPVQPVALSPEVMTLLNTVNRHVNEAIRYTPAQVLYGNADYWTLPLDAGGLRAGDCKDYVLEKRKALVEQGVPAADLSIAIVMLRRGGAHAVLLVATDHGELVLDSLSSWILPWSQVDYQWLSRQAPGQQLVWVKVGSAPRG